MRKIFRMTGSICERGRDIIEQIVYTQNVRDYFNLERRLEKIGFEKKGWWNNPALNIIEAHPRPDVSLVDCPHFTSYERHDLHDRDHPTIIHIGRRIGGDRIGEIILCREQVAHKYRLTVLADGHTRRHKITDTDWKLATLGEYKNNALAAKEIIKVIGPYNPAAISHPVSEIRPAMS